MTDMTQDFSAAGRVEAGESPFHISELFYSRTDRRGVIEAGNTVFQRVAGFAWDEMIKAPHKIIRHPDMPRGVFQLLWDNILAGQPTGAYVKNRAKSGRYYWVFALVAPVEGGFISTRLKPSSPIFETVQGLYRDVLAAEARDKLKPAASAEIITRRVQALGFADYGALQSHALATEYEARAKALGLPLNQLQRRFVDMAGAITQVQEETSGLTEAFKSIRTVPMNMRIIASRLENAGGPISAISVNYSQMLEEMSDWVDTFVDGSDCVFAQIRAAILRGQFLSFSVALEDEMLEMFTKAGGDYPACMDLDQERGMLHTLGKSFCTQMSEALDQVETQAKRLARSVLDMKRYVMGLSSTRMMCKIENAALSDQSTALNGIVEQLDGCQKQIEARLARIVELNSVIQGNTSMLRSLI